MRELTERERIRIRAQTKQAQLKAEEIDILIDALHRQTRGRATVSFDHNLALKIEKLIIGNMQRAKIIALVRAEIHKPRDSSREVGS
jgi:CheY-specific phosphatase CheX